MTTAELLRAIQHRTARVAIGSSSLRGAGNTGVVTAARTHLGRLDLRPFGTRHNDRFRAELNSATTRLRAVLSENARYWGLPRWREVMALDYRTSKRYKDKRGVSYAWALSL